MQDPPPPEPDLPKTPSQMPMLEYYRVDASRATVVTLVLAATSTTIGSLVLGYSFVLGEGPLRPLVSLLGALFTAVGPITAVLSMRRLLAFDEYLGVTRLGIVWHQRDSETVITWDGVEHVRCRGEGEPLEIQQREGGVVRIDSTFSRVGRVALAARLEELRLKAAFHLLR